MKKLALHLSMAASVLFAASCNNSGDNPDSKKMANEQNEQKADNSKTNDDFKDDTKFLTEAASGGIMEVKLGELAKTHGSNAQVKDFGAQMVTDHSKANDELMALAKRKNITVPSAPDNDKQKKIDDLAKKTGKDFDKDYIDMMVDDHKDDIDHFKKEGSDGKDADIKSWAAGKVATLEHHLEMARSAQDAMKNK